MGESFDPGGVKAPAGGFLLLMGTSSGKRRGLCFEPWTFPAKGELVMGLGPNRWVDVVVDGTTARVPEGATLLDACRSLDIEIPSLCYLETLTPANACRLCRWSSRALALWFPLARVRQRQERWWRPTPNGCAIAASWSCSYSLRRSTCRWPARKSSAGWINIR